MYWCIGDNPVIYPCIHLFSNSLKCPNSFSLCELFPNHVIFFHFIDTNISASPSLFPNSENGETEPLQDPLTSPPAVTSLGETPGPHHRSEGGSTPTYDTSQQETQEDKGGEFQPGLSPDTSFTQNIPETHTLPRPSSATVAINGDVSGAEHNQNGNNSQDIHEQDDHPCSSAQDLIQNGNNGFTGEERNHHPFIRQKAIQKSDSSQVTDEESVSPSCPAKQDVTQEGNSSQVTDEVHPGPSCPAKQDATQEGKSSQAIEKEKEKDHHSTPPQQDPVQNGSSGSQVTDEEQGEADSTSPQTSHAGEAACLVTEPINTTCHVGTNAEGDTEDRLGMPTKDLPCHQEKACPSNGQGMVNGSEPVNTESESEKGFDVPDGLAGAQEVAPSPLSEPLVPKPVPEPVPLEPLPQSAAAPPNPHPKKHKFFRRNKRSGQEGNPLSFSIKIFIIKAVVIEKVGASRVQLISHPQILGLECYGVLCLF